MNFVAFKMLTGDRGKYWGMIFGLTIASFLIIQQMSIFCGLMSRTFGFLTDTTQPDIWVMDKKVQFVDDIKPLQDTALLRVRGIDGVSWAVPLYKGLIKAKLADGTYQNCNVIGLDDATLVGGPPIMVPDSEGKKGELVDLRKSDAVIVDTEGANDKLARPVLDAKGNIVKKIPLKIGDSLEVNDKRAIVVGICKVTPTFQSQPVIYTTYNRATIFAPKERKLLSFVLVKANAGQDLQQLCDRIHLETGDRIDADRGLSALTADQFKRQTVKYFMIYTGIPVNFGISVVLGFIVGTAIAGLLFYQFTHDNIRHFGSLKAMGASNNQLLKMILLQSALVGFIGFGLGAGAASLMGELTKKSALAFWMPWWVLVGGAIAIILIVLASAVVSIAKVMRLEPAIVFKG